MIMIDINIVLTVCLLAITYSHHAHWIECEIPKVDVHSAGITHCGRQDCIQVPVRPKKCSLVISGPKRMINMLERKKDSIGTISIGHLHSICASIKPIECLSIIVHSQCIRPPKVGCVECIMVGAIHWCSVNFGRWTPICPIHPPVRTCEECKIFSQ